MPMTALPTPPSRSDPANFAARGDALMTALPTFVTEANNLEANVVAKEASATAQAAAAAASVAAASAIVGATGVVLWVSGTTYAVGDKRISPATGRVYTRITAGAGTTDPASDTTNWTIFTLVLPIAFVATNITAVANVHYIVTAGGITITAPALPSNSVDQFWVTNASGLKTSVVDFGPAKVQGQAVNAMPLNDIAARLRLQSSGNATYGWV